MRNAIPSYRSATAEPSINCHPERSHSVREANGMAESKDPYIASGDSGDAGHSPREVGRENAFAAPLPPRAEEGSFDSARAPLRGALAALRMTGLRGHEQEKPSVTENPAL